MLGITHSAIRREASETAFSATDMEVLRYYAVTAVEEDYESGPGTFLFMPFLDEESREMALEGRPSLVLTDALLLDLPAEANYYHSVEVDYDATQLLAGFEGHALDDMHLYVTGPTGPGPIHAGGPVHIPIV